MSFDIVEDWLLSESSAVLGSYYTSIESGPGEWTDRYLTSLLRAMPAVRVSFLGAESRQSTALTVDARWAVYIVNGWSKDQAARRRATGSAIGVYRAARLLAPRIHRKRIPDADTFAEVEDIDNLWTGEMDIWQVTLMAIGVRVPMALDEEIDISSIDEFLRAGVDFDVPDEGGDVDLPAAVTIRE